MSVFIRAWNYTQSDSFRKAAKGCVLPLARNIDQNGVSETIQTNGAIWYEERCRKPLRHILNGMIYTLWGLRDVYLAIGDSLALELLEQGVDSVARSLPLFDTGYWSSYWIPEDGIEYVASMMYHNLHVVQLAVLASQTGKNEFQVYADRFAGYGTRPHCRLRAAVAIARGKHALRRNP
jgi:heparosan-N-sulfate-glucuronate 5-epimerase